jgi:stage IV sporulation protein FB
MDGPTTTERAGRRWSVALATIAGVSIRVHATFLALVVFVALDADGSVRAGAAAVGWLVAVFACVVVHELAHALVARSKGIAVHEIDLLPIGGVSRLERIPDDWRDERAIAAAGPVASLVVALVALALAVAAGRPLLPVSLWDGPLLARLAWTNLVLGAFNLLPVFPLDGGRVLRATLERDRSRVDATRRAAAIGRVLALFMIGLGFVSNLWLTVIGLVVVLASRAEQIAVAAAVDAPLGPGEGASR